LLEKGNGESRPKSARYITTVTLSLSGNLYTTADWIRSGSAPRVLIGGECSAPRKIGILPRVYTQRNFAVSVNTVAISKFWTTAVSMPRAYHRASAAQVTAKSSGKRKYVGAGPREYPHNGRPKLRKPRST